MQIGHRKLAFRALALLSDEGLTFETPVGQFTLSIQLIKPHYLVILSTGAALQFL